MAYYKIKSIGEKLPLARYQKPLNRFATVLNCAFEGGILTIGVAPLCPGPFRIILESGDLDRVVSLRLTTDELIINDAVAISYDKSQVWQVEEPEIIKDFAILTMFVLQNYKLYRQKLPEDSMAALLMPVSFWGGEFRFPTAESEFGFPEMDTVQLSGFDLVIRKAYLLGLQKMAQDNSEGFVHYFKGTGFGLTPAGDDFLCGYLLALGWLEKQGFGDFAVLRKAIYEAALGTNLLVNSFLAQSYEMWLDANWLDFFNALARGKLKDADLAQKRILAYGASSGADLLFGVYMAIFKYLKLQTIKEAG